VSRKIKIGREELESEIARILSDDARPLVKLVVSRYTKSGNLLTAEDAEDVAATVDVRLVEKLRSAASDPRDSIRDLHSYVATVAHNAVNDFLRKRYPQHARLKKRLRYMLDRDGRFAVWTGSLGLVCGLGAWRGRGDVIDVPPARNGSDAYADALDDLFRAAGRPMLFDAVVAHFQDTTCEEHAIDDEADRTPAPDEQLQDRQSVRALWLEIRELPPMQRKALLLNLRYGGELDALPVLLFSGVAGIGELAAALEMGERELAAIWNELPWDDQHIASLLGVTRQQVINLRKSARERLGRRTRR